jgi:hypothetical protein
MSGDRAAVIPAGAWHVRVELAETSTVFLDRTGPYDVSMLLETLRSGLFFRYGVTDRFEVGMEIPALYRYGGFLEGLITATERATTGLAPARNALRRAGFVYDFRRHGRSLFQSSSEEVGLGDLTLSGKYGIVCERSWVPAMSARVALKIPSGDDGRFFGSGHMDIGLGLAMEKALFDRWVTYVNLNGIVPTGTVSGLALQPAFSGLLALEYLWSRNVSLVAQFDYYSSPFRRTGSPILDRGVTEVAAGFTDRLRDRVLWHVYAVENVDFIRGSAADFTLSTLVTYLF